MLCKNCGTVVPETDEHNGLAKCRTCRIDAIKKEIHSLHLDKSEIETLIKEIVEKDEQKVGRRISRSEALRISREILERAEKERLLAAEEEAKHESGKTE